MIVAIDHCTASSMVGSDHILCSANFFHSSNVSQGIKRIQSVFFMFHGMSNLSLSVNLICLR